MLGVCGYLVYSVAILFSQGQFQIQVKDSHGTILLAETAKKVRASNGSMDLKSENAFVDVDYKTQTALLSFEASGAKVEAKDLKCAWSM